VRRILAIAPALLAFLLVLAAPAAARSVPVGFFGVMANGPLESPLVDLDAEYAVMHANGVESIRMPTLWPELQPFRTLDEVPAPDRARYTVVDGVPTDFSAMDARVGAAARNHLDILALVLETPAWAATNRSNVFSAPRDDADYARFLRALIGRYGPSGTYWAANPAVPRHPLRQWQIWNEPSLPRYFAVKSFAKPYVRLLGDAYSAVKAADPGATVVTAGLPNFSWKDLETLYRAGLRAKGHFDAVAVHPFTGKAADSVRILRYVRAVMDRHGDARAGIWVTEVSWPSGRGKARSNQRWVTTPAGEATKVRQVYEAYAKAAASLRLQRAFWYSWATTDRDSPNAFDYAGLRTYTAAGRFVAKPALAAYRAVARSLG